MVKQNQIARPPAASKNATNPGVTKVASGLTPLLPACFSTNSSSLFACSRSSAIEQTSTESQISGVFRSKSPMTQTTSTCKQSLSTKTPLHDHLNKSPSPQATSTMPPGQHTNSFMPQQGPSRYMGFPGYGMEFGAYESPENEAACSPLDFYPVPQSFQEAHSFSSSYWEPSDLPFYGPEYGGPDDDVSGTPLPCHLTDEGSTDDPTPIHTPDSVTPAASVIGGDKYGSMPYAALIYKALMEAPDHKMILQDIYNWFRDNTDKVNPSGSKGWQNSIRHNLSMNEAFIKVDQEPSADGKRSFSWALHPSVIGKGYVESTTRYRKTHAHRRVSRGHSRQTSNASQAPIPARPAPKRNARKQSVRTSTPPILPRLAPSAPRPTGNPLPLAPRPPINPVPQVARIPDEDYPPPILAPAPLPPSLKTEVEAPSFASYEHVYPTLVPTRGPPLSGYPFPVALYRGQQSFDPFPEPFIATSLQADSDSGFSYAMAFDPATPESLVAPPFPPQLKYWGDGSDVAVVEYGDSVSLPSRPSSLENMLLDHPTCAPGEHSVDCWQELCRY